MTFKQSSRKKKIIIGLSSSTIILFLLFAVPVENCVYTVEQNVTRNVTVPISVCDIGPTINCYQSSYVKEVTETKKVIYKDKCPVVDLK